jgi:hypothetical protein
MREDTKPETPQAKSSGDPAPAPNLWQRPRSGDPSQLNDALFGAMRGYDARIDWGFGSGKARTLHASGAAGKVLAIVVLLGIGALISLFFIFAIGFGAVVALGAGAAAVVGLGANMWRRRLPTAHHNELGPGDP